MIVTYGKSQNRSGFTIVELLIVIVVIAILAAITIVAYNGITKQAVDSSMKSDLQEASTIVELDNTNNGTYPSDAALANSGKGLSSSGNNQLTYIPKSYGYCVAVTNPAASQGLRLKSDTRQIESGDCATTAGLVWTPQAGPAASSWNTITYGGGRFVALQGTGTATSTDGLAWTSTTFAGGNQNAWASVGYGGNRYVAIAQSGTNRITSSVDGVSWAFQPAPAANTWTSVAYGGGRFVAVASSGTNRIMTSTNGTNWTASASPEQNYWNSVTYGNGRFVAVASTGTNRVMTSTNGVSWISVAASEQNLWREVTYGAGCFIAVADSGTNRMMRSCE